MDIEYMDIERRVKRLERTNRFLILTLFIGLGSLFVSAARGPNLTDIKANSIRTRSLYVTNPYGKQGVQIEVGDSGIVSMTLTDPHGKQSVAIETDPVGTPSICMSRNARCRVLIGDVFHGNAREMSMQLVSPNGHVVWTPQTRNPIDGTK